MITQQRAEEIVQQAQEITNSTSWENKLKEAMTTREVETVNRHWSALPPQATFVEAFENIRHGTTGEMG